MLSNSVGVPEDGVSNNTPENNTLDQYNIGLGREFGSFQVHWGW